MSHGYSPVNWTSFKKRFDAWMLAGMGVYLTAFVLGSAMSSARQVLLEDRVLKLSPADALLVEQALESDEAPPQRLVEAFARHRAANATD